MTGMHLGRTIIDGVITGALLIGLFAAMNAGQPLRPDDAAEPSSAPGMAFAALGLLSFLAVAVAFGRGSGMHKRQERESSGPTFLIVLREYSLAGVLAIGLVQGSFLGVTMVISRSFALDSGAPNSLWSELNSSLLAVIAVFAAAWASTNFGVAFASLAMLARKVTLLSTVSVLVFVALSVGIVFAFLWLKSAGPIIGVIVALAALIVSVPAVIGARRLALTATLV